MVDRSSTKGEEGRIVAALAARVFSSQCTYSKALPSLSSLCMCLSRVLRTIPPTHQPSIIWTRGWSNARVQLPIDPGDYTGAAHSMNLLLLPLSFSVRLVSQSLTGRRQGKARQKEKQSWEGRVISFCVCVLLSSSRSDSRQEYKHADNNNNNNNSFFNSSFSFLFPLTDCYCYVCVCTG